MSKSRGNTIDPLALTDRYGADALRFTIAQGANPGADMVLSEKWVAGSRNFGTKLWNAARFALANGADPNGEIDPALLSDADRWILDRVGVLLRLWHPVMPFITESLWTALTGRESLVVASWPRLSGQTNGFDPAVTAWVAATQKLVTELHRHRNRGNRLAGWVSTS